MESQLKIFSDSLMTQMKDQLQTISLESRDELVRVVRSISIIETLLDNLKSFIHKYSFKSLSEEIEFFKEIKPAFLSQYFFHKKLIEIKINEPIGFKERLLEFYQIKLERVQIYTQNHIEFHLYCLSGSTHLDEKYFLRSHTHVEPQFDKIFSTGYDTILSKIIANELLKEYLLASLRKIKWGDAGLSWTGSKSALVELIYALHDVEAFNEGKADLKQIASAFESLFNISLGNYYRIFQEILLRKNGRANFLESLKEKFIQRTTEKD